MNRYGNRDRTSKFPRVQTWTPQPVLKQKKIMEEWEREGKEMRGQRKRS